MEGELLEGKKEGVKGSFIGKRNRDASRFFVQVGHETAYKYVYLNSGSHHFFTILSCHRQTYQNYQDLIKDCKILIFKAIFQC